jgi:hypothetical protein
MCVRGYVYVYIYICVSVYMHGKAVDISAFRNIPKQIRKINRMLLLPLKWLFS